MITGLTKIQLLVFAIVTLVGGTLVGGKYAQIDRFFVDRTYPVTVQLPDSGGIFAGAQVTYRGIAVGRVGSLEFTDEGVEAKLDIENDAPNIPTDVQAVVANKSAIGEQFMDLQPQASGAPFLKAGAVIAEEDTTIPLDTATLLIDVDNLVKSVDQDNLQTVVRELGVAFDGTGADLSTILDTTNAFINDANQNLPVTRSLIRNSGSVLQTQLDTQSALMVFSKNLANFSDTLVTSDKDLRRLLDEGSVSARNLNTVVSENSRDLTVTLNNLNTVAKVVEPNVLGLKAILTMFPYLVQGSYTVLQPSEEEGEEGQYDANFGVVVQGEHGPCTYAENGREVSGFRERRPANDLSDVQFPDTTVPLECQSEPNPVIRRASQTVLRRTAAASGNSDGSLTSLLLDTVNR